MFLNSIKKLFLLTLNNSDSIDSFHWNAFTKCIEVVSNRHRPRLKFQFAHLNWQIEIHTTLTTDQN